MNSKSRYHNWQTWPLKAAEEKLCFLSSLSGWLTEAKKRETLVKVLTLGSHVTEKHSKAYKITSLGKWKIHALQGYCLTLL